MNICNVITNLKTLAETAQTLQEKNGTEMVRPFVNTADVTAMLEAVKILKALQLLKNKLK